MSTVEEIEAAIAELPREEFWKIADRVMQLREEALDRRLEEEVRAGKFDALAEEAVREIEAGETQPLDEFLRHP